MVECTCATYLCPRAPRSYAIKEVNIRRLQARERCVSSGAVLTHLRAVWFVYFHRNRVMCVEPERYCSEDALNEIRILASIKHKNIIR